MFRHPWCHLAFAVLPHTYRNTIIFLATNVCLYVMEYSAFAFPHALGGPFAAPLSARLAPARTLCECACNVISASTVSITMKLLCIICFSTPFVNVFLKFSFFSRKIPFLSNSIRTEFHIPSFHSKFFQKISTHLLTLLIISVILHIEQRRRKKFFPYSFKHDTPDASGCADIGFIITMYGKEK